jgi:uncharacterized repeat protein (TIGR01451 family)
VAPSPGVSVRLALVSVLLLCLGASASLTAPAIGAPKLPGQGKGRHLGISQAPKVLYSERFENGVARAPVLLSKYQGAPPLAETYGASLRFLENCNGYVVEFESNERKVATDCEEVAYFRVRQLAWVLGSLKGTVPTANHAVSAYTDGKSTLPANSVQFETLKPIPVKTNGRFITFSVDAAETNCKKSHAELKFYLLDGIAEVPTFTKPIDPCSDKGTQVIEPPVLGEKTTEAFKAGTFAGNAATLFTGTSLGIRMRNGQTSETGNDGAFDNIEVLDATPQLEKSFSPRILNVGATSQLTYTITNTTELAAKPGWSFTDALPAGLVVDTPAMGSTTCADPTSVTATAGASSVSVSGSLAAEMRYCTVSVNVTSSKEGTYTNGPDNVTEKGLEPPIDSSVTFADNADLAIEKSAAPTPGKPGADATYTLRVTNNGPDTAKETVVSDPLPAGLSFVSADPPCVGGPAGVRCALGSLRSGDSVTLRIVVHIPDSAVNGFVNTATATSDTPDPNPSNNSSTASIPLLPEADLRIRKIGVPAKVTAGDFVAYVLLVHNDGPSDATDVTVTDPFPAALKVVASRASQGTCSTSAGVVCRLGSLGRGASAMVFLLARVAPDASGAIPNTSTVTGGQVDPTPENNSSTARIDVVPLTPRPLDPDPLTPLIPLPVPEQPVSDLGLVKHVNRAATRVGQRLAYTIEVTNHGPDDAKAVRVLDTWSLDLDVLSARPSQGSCNSDSPLECSLGTIERGASARVRVTVVVSRAGRERNTARAVSASRDPDHSNNQSSAETVVTARRTPPPEPPVTG